jgi:hypothetical protein
MVIIQSLFKQFIMKLSVQLFNFFCVTIFCTLLAASCRKSGTDENPVIPPVVNPGGSMNADTISNHLRFANAKKITGVIPKGPAGSSLKISFKDTLYLVDKWKLPVKFLHEDTTKNVAGVYIQVHAGSSGGTFYYDVPEVPDIASNDTVSVILVGIDPKGLEDSSGVPPAGGAPPFEVTIVPHDPNGQPLDEITVPVSVEAPAADINGECGLITKEGEYWDWSMSFIPDPNNPLGEDFFHNDPNKLWGLAGQNIRGCCTDGISAYTANCDSVNFRYLNFQTFFGWPNEIYKFFEDGTYAGLTESISAAPEPQLSDFCGSDPGVVTERFNRSFLEGTWTVSSSSVLTTLGTSTPQAGSLAARPLGIIDLVSCRLLIIIKPDNEGGNSNLVTFYIRHNSGSPEWFPLT